MPYINTIAAGVNVAIVAATTLFTQDIRDIDTVIIQVSGASTGLNLVVEGSVDGTVYGTLAVVDRASTTPATTLAAIVTTTGGLFSVSGLEGVVSLRVRCTAVTTGTPTLSVGLGRVVKSG